MDGDDGVEDVGLRDPGVVRPDDLAQRPQGDAQEEAVVADDAVEFNRAPRVGGQPNRGGVARGVEDGGGGVVDVDDHGAAPAPWRGMHCAAGAPCRPCEDRFARLLVIPAKAGIHDEHLPAQWQERAKRLPPASLVPFM